MIESTADYIGEYDISKAQLKEVYLTPEINFKNIKFFGHLILGRRQMPSDDWIASPMYKISYKNSEVAKQMQSREPLSFDLERDTKNKEKLKPLKNITDNTGKKVPADYIKVKMQTLPDQFGYWLDTGIFLVQIFE